MAYWTLMVAALLSTPTWIRAHQHKPQPAAKEPPKTAPTPPLPKGILVKAGARLSGLDPRMYPALEKARKIWLSHGRTLTITSGLEGRHKKNSRHYAGLALDFRTRDLDPGDGVRIARALRKALDGEFRVLMEKDHIHVQYEPVPASRDTLVRSRKPEPGATDRATAELAENAPCPPCER